MLHEFLKFNLRYHSPPSRQINILKSLHPCFPTPPENNLIARPHDQENRDPQKVLEEIRRAPRLINRPYTYDELTDDHECD